MVRSSVWETLSGFSRVPDLLPAEKRDYGTCCLRRGGAISFDLRVLDNVDATLAWLTQHQCRLVC